jgi:uncharacterized protein YycO
MNLFLICQFGCKQDSKSVLENGDIIFQTSKSSQSKAIQLATKSKYSHMGIIYIIDGEFYVFEAIQPVKLTLLEEWINRGVNKHYVVKRLKNSAQVLTKKKLIQMRKIGNKYRGKPYDLFFEWSDEKIYCSELVWKIYKNTLGVEVGKLHRLKDFDLSHPVVKELMNKRYKGKIPLEEFVISPGEMFDSKLLKTVFSN